MTSAKLGASNADVTANISNSAVTSGKINPASVQLGRKNSIINGGMTVAQRGTSSTGIKLLQLFCDRWN